jgi:four helix bundle protein
MRNFKELRVWQAAHELTLAVYKATRNFPKEELCGLTSQLRRASASIGANLAEGCGRWSDAELARFVRIAMGSASELQYHFLLAADLALFDDRTHKSLEAQLLSVRKMLTSLQQTLRQGPEQTVIAATTGG